MLVIGEYYKDSMQDYYRQNLDYARKLLEEFPTLNSILDNFEGYEKKNPRKAMNAVFRACIRVRREEKLPIYPRYRRYLEMLEKYLNDFNVNSWNSEERNELKSRLKSDEYKKTSHSLSVISELGIASELASRVGKENVELYPKLSSGGDSDILVKVDSKEVYFEVGDLSESEEEKRVKEILNHLATHIGKKIKDNRYLQIMMDIRHLELEKEHIDEALKKKLTAEAIHTSRHNRRCSHDKKGHIDVSASKKKLTAEADRILIHKLAAYNDSLSLDRLSSILKNREILETMRDRINDNDKKYLDLLEEPVIKDWLRCGGIAIKEGCIFSSVQAGSTTSKLVEIHCYDTRGNKVMESFIDHIIRHVKKQCKQLEKEKPNIIAVQGSDLCLGLQLNKGMQEDVEIQLFFKTLFEKFCCFYGKEKIKNLTGVMFFTDFTYFNNHLYIPNDYVGIKSKLSSDELQRLGIRFCAHA